MQTGFVASQYSGCHCTYRTWCDLKGGSFFSSCVHKYMTPFNEDHKLETWVWICAYWAAVPCCIIWWWIDAVWLQMVYWHMYIFLPHPLLTMDASAQMTFLGLSESKLLNEMDYHIWDIKLQDKKMDWPFGCLKVSSSVW